MDRKPVNRLVWWCILFRPKTQHGIHGRCINHLYRVENRLRVPGMFNFPEQLINPGSYHLFHEFSPQPSVTVLTAQGALIFFHQYRNLFRHRAKQTMSFLCFQVNNRAQMQFSRTRMRIMNGTKSVFLLAQFALPDFVWQVRYLYGCFFYSRISSKELLLG